MYRKNRKNTAIAYSWIFVLGVAPFVKMMHETRLTAVMMMGRRLMCTPAMAISPSAAPRSAIGPKDTPLMSSSPDRKR